MFFNVSNHPSNKWDNRQIKAAQALGGEIVDIPFPNVNPNATENEVGQVASQVGLKLWQLATSGDFETNCSQKLNAVAMVQGEPTLCHLLVAYLHTIGVRVFVATTQRQTHDNEDGTKTVAFRFVKFRELRGAKAPVMVRQCQCGSGQEWVDCNTCSQYCG